MGNKAKQRFLELSVGEVSVVDTPANEQEFIVVKRLDDEEVAKMGDTKVEKNETSEPVANDTGGDAAEKVAVEVAPAPTEAVEKAMEQITEMVASITKAAKPADVNTGGDDNKDVEKKDADSDEESTDTESTTKNEDGGDSQESNEADSDSDALDVEKMMDAFAVAVNKAKRFTPKREAALKSALETLQDLVKEMSMQQIPVSSAPKTNVPSGTKFGGSGVIALTKGLEELTTTLNTALSSIQETTKSLGDRVESIEKTRNPSASIEDDGGTDKEKPVEKSLWAGVI